MVLRKGHRIHALPVHEAEEGEFRPGEIIFYYHTSLAEGLVQQHICQSLACLLQILSDHNSLSGGESVILYYRRERPLRHISQCLGIITETAVCSRGDAIFKHKFLGELLGTLDAGRGCGMSKNLQARGTESIYNACSQGSLGAYHRQVDRILHGECLKPLYISIFQGNIESLLPYACIARSTVDFGHLRGAAQRIHYRMFTSSAADYQHGLAQTVFQGDFFRLRLSIEDRKHIYST